MKVNKYILLNDQNLPLISFQFTFEMKACKMLTTERELCNKVNNNNKMNLTVTSLYENFNRLSMIIFSSTKLEKKKYSTHPQMIISSTGTS